MFDADMFNETMPRDHIRKSPSLGLLLSSMANVLRKSSWDIVDEANPTALYAQQTIALRLPDYIKPPSKDLDSGTLEYLRSNGAFDLPSEEAQRSLLRAYIMGVHYSMPCVNVHQLSRAQRSAPSEKATVSLLLYQAVMFAGAMYATQSVLEDMGYTSRPAALRELFRRAKVSSSWPALLRAMETKGIRSFYIAWSLTKKQPVLSRPCCCSLSDHLLPPSSRARLAGYNWPSI